MEENLNRTLSQESESQVETQLETQPASPTTRGRLFLVRWFAWLPLAFAIGLGAGYLIFAYPVEQKLKAAESEVAQLREAMGAAQAAKAQQEQAAVPEKVTRYDIPVDDDPGYGPKDAPIVIVEFSDYECPFCQKWHAETWPQIVEKYGDKVRLVYRDFPLYGMHPNADPSAQAANCAGDQGKYWEFHSALFSGEYPLSRASYDAIAGNLGLDADKFAACIDTEKYKAEIEADYQFAADLGVQSTPTFFINGLALVGAQPFEVFDRVITLELNGEIPQN
jgi:protein-disulfide isomerase